MITTTTTAPVEFDLAGETYRIVRLPVMDEFQLVRKVLPILSKSIPSFLKAVSAGGVRSDADGIEHFIAPLADGLAAMKAEDFRDLINDSLKTVQRRTGDKWAPIWNVAAGRPQFEELDSFLLIMMVVKVLQGILGPFIAGLLTSQQPETRTAA